MGNERLINRKKYYCIALILLSCIFLVKLVHADTSNDYSGKQAKYIFFLVGDGLGIPQRMATEAYTGKKLLMDTFPAQGLTTTSAGNRFITGSAASATALATGVKTNINYIGVDPKLNKKTSIAEMAKQEGKKVGIISSVSIDHATPAAFYAHVKHRSMYHEIDMALAKSDFDFFGGGGLIDPTGKKSDSPMGNALKVAEENGYKIVSNKKDFILLDKKNEKIIAYNEWLQDGSALPYAMDMGKNDITLPEFTQKAIDLLDNPKGFFLMVEGGKIDWACHANDATASITNNIAFDEAVGIALNFYQKHKNETLIVVTGDHECGGLTLGFAGTKYASHFDILKHQKVSFQKFSDEIVKEFIKAKGSDAEFNDFKPVISQYFGLNFSNGNDSDIMSVQPYELAKIKAAFDLTLSGDKKEQKKHDNYILYGGYDPLTVTLTHIMSQKAGLGWTSYKHTGTPVSTSAIGPGAELFNGYYDNTDVAKKIMSIMGINYKKQIAGI